jgi:hypothetical protein
MPPSRSFQIAPSRMKWWMLTIEKVTIARPASHGKKPSKSGAKNKVGRFDTAVPAISDFQKNAPGCARAGECFA